jgi:hypothetical protein
VNPEPDLTAAITAEIERAIRTLGGNPDTLDLTDTWQVNRKRPVVAVVGIQSSNHEPLRNNVCLEEGMPGHRTATSGSEPSSAMRTLPAMSLSFPDSLLPSRRAGFRTKLLSRKESVRRHLSGIP